MLKRLYSFATWQAMISWGKMKDFSVAGNPSCLLGFHLCILIFAFETFKALIWQQRLWAQPILICIVMKNCHVTSKESLSSDWRNSKLNGSQIEYFLGLRMMQDFSGPAGFQIFIVMAPCFVKRVHYMGCPWLHLQFVASGGKPSSPSRKAGSWHGGVLLPGAASTSCG